MWAHTGVQRKPTSSQFLLPQFQGPGWLLGSHSKRFAHWAILPQCNQLLLFFGWCWGLNQGPGGMADKCSATVIPPSTRWLLWFLSCVGCGGGAGVRSTLSILPQEPAAPSFWEKISHWDPVLKIRLARLITEPRASTWGYKWALPTSLCT